MYFAANCILTKACCFMLHQSFSLIFRSLLLALAFTFLFHACKNPDSSHSEDESAYMADYESPEGRWGYINTAGELVIEARYDDAGPFSEGLASVNKRGKWGFIDQNGNEIIEP